MGNTWESSDQHGNSAGSGVDHDHKKLRLFGFELDPYKNVVEDVTKGEGDESMNSSNTWKASTTTTTTTTTTTSSKLESKKFECQYCFKMFANSQALSGHQNAHKKERMKKKRLQLQARKASINYYLQPFQTTMNHHASWFYDPSSYEEFQISFDTSYRNGSNRYAFPRAIDDHDSSKFSLIHTDRSGESRPFIFTKPLDLQLGLGLPSKIRSRPSTSS